VTRDPVTLLVATTNADKAREIAFLLRGAPVSLLTLRDGPAVAEPVESGDTFEANARLKAAYYDAAVADPLRAARPSIPILTVAEDSGLAIDALDGEPGVYSARFLSPSATYPNGFAAIEAPRRAACAPPRPPASPARSGRRRARPRAVRNARHDRRRDRARGRGGAGFGYDPNLRVPAVRQTLAEVSEARQARLSRIAATRSARLLAGCMTA
jgi:XTP/dITP diphosphohydrolase